jgi:gamma-glutamyltranspeptidase/glutathione hydrolase
MPAPVFPHAAVASPHYLASAIGLATLVRGGNAVDAAIATNLALAVVYPHMCGLGGDLFAMVWRDGELVGLNSSGRLPSAARTLKDVPSRGLESATVPGAVAGWQALAERFGAVPLSELAGPAIGLAREGCVRAPGLVRITGFMRGLLEKDPEAARIFLAQGPLVQRQLAETLETIGEFYTGPVAANAPAPFTSEDFAAHRVEWVAPERTDWLGLEVCEMPPNSRGYIALRALDAMERLDGLTPSDAEWHQRAVRAIRAVDPALGSAGDTIYLCVRDEDGMAVSLNQSLFEAFGSGVVVPGTGVLLHNRGSYLTPDEYGPGARPTHTLAPAMALRDGEPALVFGTMGGETQVQIHLQLLARIFAAGEDVGDAVAAPRWVIRGGKLMTEAGLPRLDAEPVAMPEQAGHAHAIHVRGPREVAAAFDPRSDGAAVGF